MIHLVSCQHLISGIGQYSLALAENLRNEGKEVSLFKPAKPNYLDSHFDSLSWIKPVNYRSGKGLHPYLLPLFLSKALWGFRNKGIAHAHWFLSGLALSYIQKKFVVTLHDVSLLHVSEKSGRYTEYYRWAINRFKKMGIPIITVSETARQDAIEHAGISEKQVFAIPNGIDHQRFFPSLSEKKCTENGPFTIAYAGGLGPRKNIALLLKAFRQVEMRFGNNVQILIAGAFPERTPFVALAKELHLQQVTFVGYLPDADLPNFYRQADLFVFPSAYEGFGFTPLEAMACGTPVLCAKGGALNEISGGGAAQFEYNANDLAAHMLYFIENEVERNALAFRGFRWAKQYQWQKTTQLTEEVYQLIA